jgi:CRISPR-associated protein Cas5d
MTPSAARGILEAIFWKPEFDYRVREIVPLTPVRYVSLLRNEVNSKASTRSESISVTDDRAQRNTLALYAPGGGDIVTIIRADMVLRPHATEDVAKYRDMFRRRVERGQCYHRPCLGCREFSCDFGKPEGNEVPQNWTEDLGLTLFDIAFPKPDSCRTPVPLFFEAKIEEGILRVPDTLYEQRARLAQ